MKKTKKLLPLSMIIASISLSSDTSVFAQQALCTTDSSTFQLPNVIGEEILNREKRSVHLKKKLKNRLHKKFRQPDDQFIAMAMERGASDDDILDTIVYGNKYYNAENNSIVFHLDTKGLAVTEGFDHNKQEYILQTIDSDVANPNSKWRKLKFTSNNEVLDFKMDAEDADIWGQFHFKGWIDQLTDVEKKVIKGYTGARYQDINNYLRNESEVNKPEKEKRPVVEPHKVPGEIASIDSALNKSYLPENMVVYRRVTDEQFSKESNTIRPQDTSHNFGKIVDREALHAIRQQFVDTTFVSANYMSTSIAQDQHPSYAKHPVLLRIFVPEGIHAGFIDNLSGYSQSELLIQRGYAFRYTSFDIETNQSGTEYIVANVVLEKSDN
ncbi:hypothetical protein BM86_23785 [Bacillus thuringiensis]|uniref:ADP-ribosyltransferase certhrax n=1 Tax=Bacillus thuringiensis TaxID=1428 RepID=A0A9W3SIH9_BACTU|nr:ADP-ribosyltransferase [Bacillus thuringiensis]ANS52026.1 putative ADP-ribosyltransferase certhrax [Bacillus thuringiensis]MBH0338429.1 hypothetical protein [Bacillus thuringiensis]